MFTRGSSSFFVVLAAIAALGLPLTASAVPITGSIGFGGAFTPTGGTGLSDATGISFDSVFFLAGTGDFDAIPDSPALFTDFDFNPFSGPVDPLWQISLGGTNFSFDLDQILIDVQDANFLNLSGTGTLMAAGFDDTAGSWTFSGNSAGTIVFTFSSITAASAVAEPGVLILLGLGLPLIGVVRRRTLNNNYNSGEK